VIPRDSKAQGVEKPPKKQRQSYMTNTPEIKRRGRGGKLRKLAEMPLEILFEVYRLILFDP
jgi:hypothetical protein